MQLVVDSNILLAALVKSAATRSLILDPRLNLVAPEHLLFEVSKHIKDDEEFRSKIKLNDAEVEEILSYLLEKVEIKPKDLYNDFTDEALKLVPHEKDTPFFALALFLNCAIWSNEKALKGQSKVKVLSTDEIVKLLQFPL